jgi:hypothetical protein
VDCLHPVRAAAFVATEWRGGGITSRKTAGLQSAKKVPVTDGRHGQFREENDFGCQA